MSQNNSSGQQPLWRVADPKTFEATVVLTAQQLRIQPLAVEKDYWICEALRSIESSFPNQVIFKGGTSLEKLRLIQRFSEDLDLLYVGSAATKSLVNRQLKRLCKTASSSVGGTSAWLRSGGELGRIHRSEYLYPVLSQQALEGTALADPDRFLIELGQSGGSHPSKPREVSSLLTRQLLQSPNRPMGFADLEPFTVQVLHPGRTLLEKLLRVNNFVLMEDAQREYHGWPRIGRQFYDIWALLGSQEVLTFLADHETVRNVLADCYEVSKSFHSDEPPPNGGFAQSAAFAPKGKLADALRVQHERAMREFYYGFDSSPSFDEVLERVHAHKASLNVDSIYQ